MKQCDNGHVYNDNKYDSCPYCRKDKSDVTFGGNIPIPSDDDQAFPRTMPVNNSGRDFPKTTGTETANSKKNESREMSKTVALGVDYDSKKQDGEPEQLVINPVVAWIVCTEGDYKGISFPLHSNKNYIGRGSKFDVDIYFDSAVSSEGDAVINFDALGKKFYIIPGSGKNNVYVNNKCLLSNMIISDYDIIRIGVNTYVFRSLCGEQFMY